MKRTLRQILQLGSRKSLWRPILSLFVLYFIASQLFNLPRPFKSAKVSHVRGVNSTKATPLITGRKSKEKGVLSLNSATHENGSRIAQHEVAAPEDIVPVLIVSYQRTGSTFLGNLFSRHPEAFYAFEPLDGLYVAMYGTSPGYNVPSDITTFWDGTPRSLTQDDIVGTADALEGLLTCDYNSLPLEMQLHDFWYGYREDHRRLQPFLSCLQENEAVRFLTKECGKAANRMLRHCGTWFGKNRKTMEVCHKNLWPLSSRKNSKKPFKAYTTCINKRANIAKQCVPFIKSTCSRSRLRTAKVVRPTMQSLPILLQRLPKLKILHLFRKPQAVAKSRLKYSSVRGHSSGHDITKEAKLYCKDAVNDLKLRKKLEEKFPNSFKTVIYEEVMKHPAETIRDIYSFLGEDNIPEAVFSYFTDQKFVPDKKSGWNNTHSAGKSSMINQYCKDLYAELKHTW